MGDHASRRRRGRESEKIAAEYLRGRGWDAAEAAPPGRWGADLTGIPGVAIECKARRGLDLPAWLRQAAQTNRSGLPLLIVRGVGQGPANVAEWAAVTALHDMAGLLREAGY